MIQPLSKMTAILREVLRNLPSEQEVEKREKEKEKFWEKFRQTCPDPSIKVLFRPLRRTLAEAMEGVLVLQTRKELIENLINYGATEENLTIEPYGFDERIGWNTFIVCVAGDACGFTNGDFTNG